MQTAVVRLSFPYASYWTPDFPFLFLASNFQDTKFENLCSKAESFCWLVFLPNQRIVSEIPHLRAVHSLMDCVDGSFFELRTVPEWAAKPWHWSVVCPALRSRIIGETLNFQVQLCCREIVPTYITAYITTNATPVLDYVAVKTKLTA